MFRRRPRPEPARPSPEHIHHLWLKRPTAIGHRTELEVRCYHCELFMHVGRDAALDLLLKQREANADVRTDTVAVS